MRSPGLAALLAAALACNGEPGDTVTTDAPSSDAGPSASTATDPTGGPAGAMTCVSQCSRDADCLLNGMDVNFRCIAGACAVPPCTGDPECVALLSGWTKACAGDEACGAGEACVDRGDGEGRCAMLADDAMNCTNFGLAEVARAPISGGAAVTVCGNDGAACVAGVCDDPCDDDGDCNGVPGTPTCDVSTGICVCTSDLDCASAQIAGFVACEPDGRCGCAQDSDCAGPNIDRCNDGACGCSGQDVCVSSPFDGATPVCK